MPAIMGKLNSTNVLVLTPYPVATARHGGQLRVQHILDGYRASGMHTEVVAVFPQGAYPGASRHDLLLPPVLNASLDPRYDAPLADYLSGVHAAADAALCTALARRLAAGNYQVVQLEHPFLWPLLQKALAQAEGSRPCVVYSSHNVEYTMKAEILRRLGAPSALTAQAEQAIRALETDLVRQADLVWAVSAADVARLRAMRERQAGVHLFGNGVGLPSASEAQQRRWRDRTLPTTPFPTFISSYHLPNALGFFSMLSSSLAFLPLDTRLVVAGGISNYLEEAPAFNRWSGINRARSLLLGTIEDVGIAALRRYAHLFILPITSGGGSNIKTAEALVSGQHVLGTTTALRGFEGYLNAPGVHVEDDPARFRQRMVTLLREPRLTLAAGEVEARHKLLWQHTLAGMADTLRAHLAQPVGVSPAVQAAPEPARMTQTTAHAAITTTRITPVAAPETRVATATLDAPGLSDHAPPARRQA